MRFFFGNMDSVAFGKTWDYDHGSFISPTPLSVAFGNTPGFYFYYSWYPGA